MSKQKNLKLNSKNNETASKKLFKPLSQKEQQTVTGGWSSRSSTSSGTTSSGWGLPQP